MDTVHTAHDYKGTMHDIKLSLSVIRCNAEHEADSWAFMPRFQCLLQIAVLNVAGASWILVKWQDQRPELTCIAAHHQWIGNKNQIGWPFEKGLMCLPWLVWSICGSVHTSWLTQRPLQRAPKCYLRKSWLWCVRGSRQEVNVLSMLVNSSPENRVALPFREKKIYSNNFTSK